MPDEAASSATPGPAPTARRWEIQHADAWRQFREEQDSPARRRFAVLAETTRRMVRAATTPNAAAGIAAALPETLSRCNELQFDRLSHVIAYSLWHLCDRYARVGQVLDVLFAAGDLPLRRRELSVLEVGSGPAPAIYAVADYYATLSDWSVGGGHQVGTVAPTRLHTVERGEAWNAWLHQMSEQLHVTDPELRRPLTFGVTYNDFTGFSVVEGHRAARERLARHIQADYERADESVSLQFARLEAASMPVGPPSAYDLIVMSNFLTSEALTERFAAELAAVSSSLTPGGVLLVLGSAAKTYTGTYAALADCVGRSRLRPLPASGGLQAVPEPWAAALVTDQIRDGLRHIDRMAPDGFAAAMAALEQVAPGNARELRAVMESDAALLSFPRYQLHAWKNEGPHLVRRRSGPAAG